MSSRLERTLGVLFLAGVAAVVPALRETGGRSLPNTISLGGSTTIARPATPVDYPSEELLAVSTTVQPVPTRGGRDRVNDPDPAEPPDSFNTGPRANTESTGPESHGSTPTTRDSASVTPVGSTTDPPPATAQPTTTTSQPLPTLPEDTTAPSETPRSCAPVQDLWEVDGYPVEDPCTLAEVKRVFNWAWTGTGPQRRSAIRNGHLLDEVFAALDEYGRLHDAGLFDPETRGDWTVVFDGIHWRGGPRHDRAVIAVTHGFTHRDYPHSPRWTSTAVQVDGEWKLSYRRSYCLQADAILEYSGSDVRCPPDPHPEVNEHEDPDIIREYES